MLAIHPILKKGLSGITIIKYPIPALGGPGNLFGIKPLIQNLQRMPVNGLSKK